MTYKLEFEDDGIMAIFSIDDIEDEIELELDSRDNKYFFDVLELREVIRLYDLKEQQ